MAVGGPWQRFLHVLVPLCCDVRAEEKREREREGGGA